MSVIMKKKKVTGLNVQSYFKAAQPFNQEAAPLHFNEGSTYHGVCVRFNSAVVAQLVLLVFIHDLI